MEINMYDVFCEKKILAILRNVSLEITEDYVRSIMDGGIDIFEVALNSEHAYKQIELIRKTFGDKVMVGAGTVISVEKAKKAIEAGAQFLLSPSTQEEVLSYCYENNIKFLPGVLTPTDVACCLKYGFTTMKLFPAGELGEKYVKNLKGPFSETDYVAIGGVDKDNIRNFFEQGYLAVGLGSNIMPKEIIRNREWEKGTQYVKNLKEKIFK